jgi:hypothetical protein
VAQLLRAGWYRPGPAIVFDSIQIAGQTKTKARFLSNDRTFREPLAQQRLLRPTAGRASCPICR